MSRIGEEIGKLRQSVLARNAGWMALGQGTGLVLQAAYFLMLARLLGATEYGIFVGAFALSSLFAQYSPLGTGTLFIRYVSHDRELFSIYWGNILLVTLSVGCAITLLLHLFARHLVNSQSANLVLLAAFANCVCAQLTTEIGRIFQTFEKLRTTALLNLSTSLMRTVAVGGLLILVHHASAWIWALASTMVSAIAATVAVIVVTASFGKPRIKPALFAERLWEGVGFSFAASTTSVYNDLDKTMLSHYGMNLANGIYSMAYRVIDIATIPVFAIRDAALPRLFKRGRVGIGDAGNLAKRLLKWALPVSILLAVVVFLTAPLVPLIVGAGFAESVEALRWLCLIPIFRSIHQMTGGALTGAGFQPYRTVAQVIAALINLSLNLVLIPRHGWHGAAWASLFTDASLAVLNSVFLAFLTSQAMTKTAKVLKALT